MTIKQKMTLGTLLPLLIGTAAICGVFLHFFRQNVSGRLRGIRSREERVITQSLRGRIEAAHSLLARYHRLGKPPREALRTVKAIRFGPEKKNYIWVHELYPSDPKRVVIRMHADPSLIGRDLTGLIDFSTFSRIYHRGRTYPKGHETVKSLKPVEIFRAFNTVCLKEGAGVVRYHWYKSDDSGRGRRTGYRKISYVKLFRPWNYVLGAGAYADHIDSLVAAERGALERESGALALSMLLLVALITAAATIVMLYWGRQITRPIQELSRSARAAADGRLETLPSLPRSRVDEVTSLVESIRTMHRSILDQIRRIRINENDLRITLNSIGDAVIATDKTGRVTRLNPVAARLTGWSEINAKDKPLENIFHIINAHTRRAVENPVWKVLRNGQTVGLANHTILVSRNGQEYQIADSAAPIRDDAERTTGVVLVFRDVTLEYSKQRELRLAWFSLDRISQMVFWLNSEGRFTYVNETACRILGYSREELQAMTVFDIDPVYTPRMWSESWEQIKRDRTLNVETQHRTRSGNTIPVEISGNYLNYEDREYLFAFCEDIRERRRQQAKQNQTERELAKARNYIENIINSMPSMLIGVDAEGKIPQWNRRAETESGVPSSRATGRLLTDVLPRLSTEMDRIREALRTRREQDTTTHTRRRGDESRFEDITVYPLISNGAEGAVIRIDDTTEKMRIEEMMLQSEKMLSVGGLAAGMAHEINNPLGGMIQNAQNMERRLGDTTLAANRRTAEELDLPLDSVKQYMDKRGIFRMLKAIRDSGKRASAIVENMLSFARKTDADRSAHDLGEIMDRALQLAATDYDLKKQYDFRDIRLVKDYDENTPPVQCERNKIQQVLLNILRNGAEAMHDSGIPEPAFTLRLRYEQDRETVRVEIADNGPGMDDQTRRRVFEPFFTTKPTDRGTGLGLSVSYFIITENHNGEMWADSQPGRGTAFFFRLPISG